MLLLKRYAWLCVLGGEIVYFVCLIGGLLPLRNSRAVELHHLAFELLPGFTWINIGSVIIGAIYVFIFSWVFAWYMVWMHNTSTLSQ